MCQFRWLVVLLLVSGMLLRLSCAALVLASGGMMLAPTVLHCAASKMYKNAYFSMPLGAMMLNVMQHAQLLCRITVHISNVKQGGGQ